MSIMIDQKASSHTNLEFTHADGSIQTVVPTCRDNTAIRALNSEKVFQGVRYQSQLFT
ncbi:MAG: hypothetical protein FJY09_05865 [Chlorobi bacterium]|nr:hypothetical protein [Chlorobiota bacterium]